MGIRLLVATKAKLVRQLLVKKERCFIHILCNLGEWQTSHLKTHLCITQSPTALSRDQNKSQRPGFLLHFKVPSFGAFRRLLSSHPVA